MYTPVYTLKSALQYFKDYNSHEYAFLDAWNAFDRVNQWVKFKKEDRQIPIIIIRTRVVSHMASSDTPVIN